MRPLFRSLLSISILVYLLYGLLIIVRQDALLYYPNQGSPELKTCARHVGGIAIKDTRFPLLNGLFYQKSTSTVIVIHHANATNACERALYVTALTNNAASIFIVSYPGYLGDMTPPSTGRIQEEVAETVAWIKAMKMKTVGIIGESIGTGPASLHAALNPAPLALVAPYATLSQLAESMFPLYPIRAMLRDDYYVSTWVRTAPSVLIIAGTHDATVPLQHSEKLFAGLPQKRKYFYVLPFDHDGLLGSAQSAHMIANFFSFK